MKSLNLYRNPDLVDGCRCGKCTHYKAPEIRCSHARILAEIENARHSLLDKDVILEKIRAIILERQGFNPNEYRR